MLLLLLLLRLLQLRRNGLAKQSIAWLPDGVLPGGAAPRAAADGACLRVWCSWRPCSRWVGSNEEEEQEKRRMMVGVAAGRACAVSRVQVKWGPKRFVGDSEEKSIALSTSAIHYKLRAAPVPLLTAVPSAPPVRAPSPPARRPAVAICRPAAGAEWRAN